MPKKTRAKRTEIDWNLFVHQPDTQVNSDHAEATKQNLKHIERNFRKSLTNNARFTQRLDPPDAQTWLKNITLRVVEGFLRWYLDNHNVEYQSTFLVFARYFRMYWCEEMRREFSYDLRRKMTMLVCTTLTDEYELDLGGKTQPSVNIDDLLYSTYHLLAVCDIAFPTFRCQGQLSTLRKMMTSTSARPGTLVESSGYMRSNDALKWKDIELYMVKNPDNPTCQVLLMRVTHRLNKGKRNKGVPPVFIYTERNDNLGLCVIQDILEYAFLDNAFASERIKCPRDIWNLTEVPEHRLSTTIHFKEAVKEIPIFRRAVKNGGGLWITDPRRALNFGTALEYEKSTSISAGSKQKGTFYKYRKGAAANLRHLDEHSRNVIMGHQRSGTFAYYVSVRDDTQSAFMETPARDALLKLACNSSLTRDASAPQHLTEPQRRSLEKDKELDQLKRECQALRNDLIAEFHQLNKAKCADAGRYNAFLILQRRVKARRKKIHDEAKERVRNEFFENIGNHIIDQNYQGTSVKFQPDTSHIQPERKQLAELEFKNRDVDNIDDAELIEDRIRSLELRLRLHGLHVPKSLRKRVKFESMPAIKTEPQPFPMKSVTGLECPVCLGVTDIHPTAKQFRYSRKNGLQKHFRTHKLPQMFPNGRQCDIPGCSEVLFRLPEYMLHQAECHKIIL
ncbi:uncharacterized protein N7473_011096 [Penicillium subrubescens]|nr:uncharacterized protein N7473_011096 [Penicillium subrubescens]KAJ5882834.1 hypothetical protein N7473_011096 [Penicillium subrubescens]